MSAGPWKIALVLHPDRPAARDLAAKVREFFEARGHQVVEDASDDGPDMSLFDNSLDVAIALGGDGTMLRTAHAAVAESIPVLGINLGALGYLTEVEPVALEHAFERLLDGDFTIDERMTLDVSVTADGAAHEVALNDAAIAKTRPAHTIRLRLGIGGDSFLTYVADGFLVSSPGGSTAYNLSLRGPIVSPQVSAVVLTPIAPHMLFDRSLVVAPHEEIELELLADRPAVLIVDGRSSIGLQPGDTIRIRGGKRPARFITFETSDFYGVLRSKFGLTDR
jgi:NAD+ kinase